MADDPGTGRVLVVDDAPEYRVLICRVLASRGYHVDAVETLAEARAMTPREYDAILVDMRLGSERGVTLITELTAADPGLASRCLLMSGHLEHVPSGVASLSKPFLPHQLLGAVRALRGTDPAATAGAGPGEEPSAPALPAAREPTAFAGPAVTLLGVSSSLRARELDAVAYALHDGPVQDLAGAILGLHLIRGQLPAAQAELLDSAASLVSAATASLRTMMDRRSPRWLGEPPAETIRNQTAWLLAVPPVVDIRPPADQMSQEQGRFAASVAELALFLASGAPVADCQLPSARILVLDTEQAVDIETTIRWAAGDPRDTADTGGAATAWRESLRGELESALAADIEFTRRPGELHVLVSLRETSGDTARMQRAQPQTPPQ